MIRMRWIRLACVTLFVAGVIRPAGALGASAVEELTKRMPDDVIGFVGTSGCDALKGDFQKTALGRIWNDQGVRTFYQSIKTELMTKAKQESGDPNLAQKADLVLSYVQLALSRPIVIGVAQAPVREGPPVAAFAILDGGNRKSEITAAVGKLEAMIGQDEIADREVGSLKMRGPKDAGGVPVYWGWAGNSFVIALNDGQGVAAKYLSQPRSAASAYLNKVPGSSDAFVTYGDVQRIRQIATSLLREEEGEEASNALAGALKGLGLSEVRSFATRVGFAGSDVVVDSLVELPTPATGLFAALRTADPAWFRAVDVRAVTANAANCDLAALYDTVMATVKGVLPPDAFAEVQKAIAGFESQVGLRIREELLASLAGPMISYSLPAGSMVEAPRGGAVVAAKIKDAQMFEKTMEALGKFVGEKAKGMLQVGSQKRDDGRIVHTWTIAPVAMIGVMPTWSIANDHVVIATSMELCDLGVKQLVSKGAEGKSLLDAEGYKKVAADLPKNLSSIAYVDSAVQLNQVMMQLQQLWPMATMMAMQQGLKLPVMLPSLSAIAKDMSPSIDYAYFGPDGLRSHYRGSGIEAGGAAVAGGAVGAAVLMPALAKGREQARITASMSNLKQLGLACHMYAEDHQEKFPDDLAKAKEYYRDSKILESPRKPKDFSGPSYIYIPSQSQEMNPGNIVAYENPDFAQDRILALFLDGHVESMPRERFEEELKATYERLGRKMPEDGA